LTHSHDHDGAEPVWVDTAYKWAVLLNAAYVATEAAAGFWIGSLSLLADAAHNLTDVAGLLIAWTAAWAAQRVPTANFAYGFGKATVFATFLNAVAIAAGAGAVSWEAIQRFSSPAEVQANIVMAVAIIGIVMNTGTALLFRAGSSHDLNARGAYLHMMADATVSGGFVLSAGLMWLTHWSWLDPLAAIVVSLLIGWSSTGLLRSATRLMFDGAPAHVSRARVEECLRAQNGVRDLHDLHIWALSTTTTAMTVHLVMPGGHPGDSFLEFVADEMAEHSGLNHTSIQIETGEGAICKLASPETIRCKVLHEGSAQ
jgi:cobalt-zinc-cadmium efflux system protein